VKFGEVPPRHPSTTSPPAAPAPVDAPAPLDEPAAELGEDELLLDGVVEELDEPACPALLDGDVEELDEPACPALLDGGVEEPDWPMLLDEELGDADWLASLDDEDDDGDELWLLLVAVLGVVAWLGSLADGVCVVLCELLVEEDGVVALDDCATTHAADTSKMSTTSVAFLIQRTSTQSSA
jgi:hypothetical protein